MTIYEVWQVKDGTQVTVSTLEGIEDQRKKGLMPGKWRRLHRFEAENWTAAMTKYHELMGFEPYRPRV